MATTRIISLHGRNGQSISQTLRDRINYAENPKKRMAAGWSALMNAYRNPPPMNLP